MPFHPVRYLVVLALPATAADDPTLLAPLTTPSVQAVEVFRDWVATHPAQPAVDLRCTSPYHVLFDPNSPSSYRSSYSAAMHEERRDDLDEELRQLQESSYTAIFMALSLEDHDILTLGIRRPSMRVSIAGVEQPRRMVRYPIKIANLTLAEGDEATIAQALQFWFASIEPQCTAVQTAAQQLETASKNLPDPAAVCYASLARPTSLLITSNGYVGQLNHIWAEIANKYEEWESQIPFIPRYDAVRHISLRMPWSEAPARSLCRALLQGIGFEAVYDVAQTMYTFNDCPEYAKDFVDALLGRRGTPMLERRRELLAAYLYDQCSAADLRKLGLSHNLTTQERYSLVQIIITALGERKRERLWVDIDYVEDLGQITGKKRFEILRGLEQLIESTPEHLTLWLHVRTQDPAVLQEVDDLLADILPFVNTRFPAPKKPRSNGKRATASSS